MDKFTFRNNASLFVVVHVDDTMKQRWIKSLFVQEGLNYDMKSATRNNGSAVAGLALLCFNELMSPYYLSDDIH